MYEYKVKVVKVVDGDTIDVDIDLGFGMVYKKQRVRMVGIDTPESRTRDKVEKLFGKASKKHLKKLLEECETVSLVSHDKGKFGRILGTLYAHHVEGHPVFGHKVDINTQMIKDCHAVVYSGENKDLVEQQHLDNRKFVMDNGYVTQEEIDKVS
jgi:micrococcal nuclease|tara:strand:+ start:464 stop:925 length:462 start_codon:yes stop_codon:yes gene_type:complete